jgi:hypothetical protein
MKSRAELYEYHASECVRVFRIGDDGKLTFARKYDIDVGDKTMFWMGMVPL